MSNSSIDKTILNNITSLSTLTVAGTSTFSGDVTFSSGVTGAGLSVAHHYEERSTTSASSTTVVTGLGFQPKAVIAFGGVSGTYAASVGFQVGSGIANDCIYMSWSTATGGIEISTARVIRVSENGGTGQQDAYIGTYSSTGFSVVWASAGTPGGAYTIKMSYLAIG